MKSIFVLSFFFLTATQAFAGLKKEIWTCTHSEMEIKVTFENDRYSGKVTHSSVEGDVPLTLKRAGQTNALTGSQRTQLKGNYSGWDSYNYKVTLIRNRMDDFHPGGSANKTVMGTAMVEIDAELDCYGQRLDVMTLDCQVKVIRQ